MLNKEAFIYEMVQHYIVCALWSSLDESNESGGVPLERNYDADDIAPESYAKALKDCEQFVEQNAALLEGLCADQTGHDFWLTRNRHGVGFWDRGLGDIGDKLTDACKKFGEQHAIVGGDGQIYLE